MIAKADLKKSGREALIRLHTYICMNKSVKYYKRGHEIEIEILCGEPESEERMWSKHNEFIHKISRKNANKKKIKKDFFI